MDVRVVAHEQRLAPDRAEARHRCVHRTDEPSVRPRGSTSKRVIGLRAATLLTSVALVAFLVAGLWLFLHNLVSTRMQALEIESTRRSGETARNLVAVAEENQLESARDWGIWNATWDFVHALDQGRDDEAYRSENLNPVSLINAGAPVIIYLDNDARIVEALVVENDQSIEAPPDVRSADWARLAGSVGVDGACGLVQIGDRVLVVGVSPITQARASVRARW
jgi:sensor domain CHASE-containing protein